MRVKRMLNNNVIMAIDDEGNDIVVVGKGLAFSLKRGDLISQDKIKKLLF